MWKGLLTVLLLSANFAIAGTDDEARQQITDLSARVAQLQENLNLIINKLNNQSAVSILNKLDDLQSQIDQINGNIETLKHNQQAFQNTQDQVNQSIQQQIETGVSANNNSTSSSAKLPSDSDTVAAKKTDSPSLTQVNSQPTIANTDLKTAIGKIKSHDFSGAIHDLQNIINNSKTKTTVANATYYLAIAYAANTQYKDSIATAKQFISANPQNKNIPDAMRTIYIDQKQLGMQKSASNTARILIKSYPHSDAAKKVQQEQ